MKNTLGERIAEKRKAKGLKQDELAEMLGISAQAVSKWENDISCPDIMTLPDLAQRLGCTVDELLTGREEPKAAVLVPEGERKDFDKLMLRVLINACGGETVRVNLPMPLVKLLLESGVSINTIGGDKMNGLNIDWDAIVSMVERGVIGKLVEIDSGRGDTILIVVE